MKNDKKDLGPVSVEVDPKKSVEGALKKFKRLVDSAGIVREYRRRKNHIKKSVAKKEKRKAAETRRVKELKKLNQSTK